MKNIILLGSTGSVGSNVLDVVRKYPDKFKIKAICANNNIELLASQVEEFSPEIVCVADEKKVKFLKEMISSEVKIVSGRDEIESIAGEEESDIVFIAISGTQALLPLISALSSGRTVALASKEPIVSAGMLISSMLKKGLGKIIPVDSEHSAIMQCLGTHQSEEISRVYITGSGGSLKDVEREDFDKLSINDILRHPKWSMGKKITVDSATLMNKGLEAIEARWLFDIDPDKISIVMHPEAVVHSMVEFVDGTVTAGMFCPDMRFPILKAMAYPDILPSDFPKINFPELGKLTFLKPDTKKFPALSLAIKAMRDGGTAPAVLNSANEVSVNLFLDGKIRFTQIISTVEKVLNKHKRIDVPSLQDILEAEAWANEEVLKAI